jgi:UDP-glucose 4-epimerase
VGTNTLEATQVCYNVEYIQLQQYWPHTHPLVLKDIGWYMEQPQSSLNRSQTISLPRSPKEQPFHSGYHLILGGSGFIGRHVAILLARAGSNVVIASRTPPAQEFEPEIKERIAWRSFHLGTAQWDDLIEDASVVHHYAWASIPASANDNPALDLDANVMPTLSLLEAMRRKGKDAPVLLFASSGGTVYGRLRRVPVEEDHPLSPITAYGAGKAAAEMYVGIYRALYGLDCRIARLANPFGAGQDLSKGLGAATTFLHHALTEQPIVIWGDGEVVRDYIHISDAASGLVALATALVRDGPWIFNIGSGEGISLNAIVAELEARLGRRLDVRREPGRAFDVPVSVLDITRIREVLGWTPELSFSEGIGRTLADLRLKAENSSLN